MSGINQPTGHTAEAKAIPPLVFVAPMGVGLGAAMMSMATKDLAPLIGVWPALLVLAMLVLWRHNRIQRTAAIASISAFSSCLLVAGLAHVYSTAVFGSPFASTIEVPYFYEIAREGLQGEMPAVNAPYALLVWRAAYDIAALVGLGDGLWIGLVINAFLVAISVYLVVRTIGLIFPGDWLRIRRGGHLLLWCPFFWIFGALLVRDAFALLIQVLLLATFVSFLLRPSAKCLLSHSALIAVLAVALVGIRVEMLITIPVAAVLAAVSLMLQSSARRRAKMLLSGGSIVVLILLLSWEQIVATVITAQEGYLRIVTEFDDASSGLGYRLIVSQPLPIRLVAGSVYMHMFPIPFWVGFNFDSLDYHWLKSLAGLFMIIVTPLGLLGIWRALRRDMQASHAGATTIFLALYWPTMLAAVAVTSLETRHLAQFVPVLVMLALIPNLRDQRDRVALRVLALCWYGSVILVHVLWLILR